jgi:CBS domain-containing protein
MEDIMPISEICNRNVIIAKRDDTAMEAAKLMRQHHVGDIVVIEESNGVRIPVGIVTDRDLVVEIIAPELDYRVITVGDIMRPELVTVKENMGVYEAIQYMQAKGVRRLPVVDMNDGLVGILALDDLLELLSEEIFSLAKLVTHEQKKEAVSRR